MHNVMFCNIVQNISTVYNGHLVLNASLHLAFVIIYVKLLPDVQLKSKYNLRKSALTTNNHKK